MKEDQDLSTRVYGQSRNARQVAMRMQRKSTGTHRHVRVGANNASEKMEPSGTWVHQVARAMEEHVGEDEQELNTREQKKLAKDAKKMCRFVHETDKKRRNKSCVR